MNKADLVAAVAKDTGLPQGTCKEVVDSLVEVICANLKKGEDIAIAGFGTFAVTARKARVGVNPATGKKINIPAKKVPKFKAGKQLKDLVA